jgi:hypothetical protein
VEVAGQQFFSPYFYRALQNSDGEARMAGWKLYVGVLAPLLLLLAAALISCRQPIADLVLAKKFSGAAPYIAVGAIVEGIRVLAGVYALAAHATMRTKALLLPHSVGAVAVTTGLVGGTLLVGKESVPFAMIGAAVLFLAVMHNRMIAHSGVKLHLYGTRTVAVACGLLAGLGVVHAYLPRGITSDLFMLFATGVTTLVAGALCLNSARAALRKMAA